MSQDLLTLRKEGGAGKSAGLLQGVFHAQGVSNSIPAELRVSDQVVTRFSKGHH